jgi:hypothetical protein
MFKTKCKNIITKFKIIKNIRDYGGYMLNHNPSEFALQFFGKYKQIEFMSKEEINNEIILLERVLTIYNRAYAEYSILSKILNELKTLIELDNFIVK